VLFLMMMPLARDQWALDALIRRNR